MTNTTGKSTSAAKRVAALDVVRFSAAMMVVLYHYTARHGDASFPILRVITEFGYLGVPIFFVVSGFVIAMSADNRTATQFLVSRATRLYPAYWICMAITLAIGSTIGSFEYTVGQILTNLTLLNDYLGHEDIDGVYWTLHAEIKFYACIFALMVTGLYKKHVLWIPVWLVCTLTFLVFEQPFFMGWFISPYYSCFFIAGILFYRRFAGDKSILLYSMLMLVFAISTYMGYQQAGDFIEHITEGKRVVAAIAVFLSLVCFYLIATETLTLKSSTTVVVIGGITYPLYLSHNISGVTLIDYFAGNMQMGLIIPIMVVVMLLLSYVVYRYMEQPVIKVLRRQLLVIVSVFEKKALRKSQSD